MNTLKNTVAVLLSFMAVSMTSVAQSCDARYPMGVWQTTMKGEKDPELFVNLMITREPGECGSIDITEYESDKIIFSAALTYAGKEMKDNMPTGTYYFNLETEEGKIGTISVNGSRTPVVIGTGVLKDHPAFKLDIVHCPGAMGGTVGEQLDQYCQTEEDLLDNLRWYLKYPRIPVEGFGDVKQFVAAHAKLDPSKPKYAKPKGTGAINIRALGKVTAEKVGELKPGETLLVTDEYDGWCQVKLGDKKFGWVSLSVVTLTNNQGTAAVPTATQETFPPVVNGHLAFMGIPMNVSPTLMKSKLMSMGMTPAKDKWSEGEDFWLEGMVNGVKTQVWVSVDGNHKIYNINTYDAKSYKLAQAQARYKKLLDSMVATYGKGAYQTNESGFKEYYIRSDKGVINVQLFNEDEMEGASTNHKVAVYYSEHTD